MPRSFLSAFHSPADSTVLPPRLRSLRPPVRPFEARWPAVERDHSSREGRRFKKNSRAGPPTVKRARGAHIVIRGSRLEAERERERERGSWIKNGFGSVLCTADAFRRATTCHGWHTQFARSLARCFCERVLPLPGQPVVRSLARSPVYLRSVVVSAPVFQDRVFGGVPSSTEKALGISLRAEP